MHVLRNITISLAVLAGILLAACQPRPTGPSTTDRLSKRIETETSKAKSNIDSSGVIRRAERPYLGEVQNMDEAARSLPSRVQSNTGFSLATDAPLSLEEISARVTSATGLHVIVDLDLVAAAATLRSKDLRARFSGPLSEFLDLTSRHWDATWTYSDGVIQITNAITRIYSVRASAAVTHFSLETSETGFDTGANSSSLRLKSEVWNEIDTALAEIVSPGNYQLSPSAGIVTVTAPPSVHRAVGAYLEQSNAVFDARIFIEVAAAFLDVADLDDFGLSLDFLHKMLDGDATVRLGRASEVAAPGIASFIASGESQGSRSRSAGSSVILRALSRTERVIDYRTASVITRHGSPIPISLARKRDIVRNITVTVSDEERSTSVEAETLNTGLSISALPRILDKDRVHLTLSLVARDLVNLAPFRAGEQGTIHLATIDERRLTHDLVIGRNETLLLAGYEQQKADTSAEGIGAPSFNLLGGGRTSGTRRSRLYLLVSASILR